MDYKNILSHSKVKKFYFKVEWNNKAIYSFERLF